MSRRGLALWISAILAVPAAVLLTLLAIEVFRVPRDLAAEDVRFQAAPRLPRTLWDDLGFLPGDPGARLLGASDDVRSRQTVALFARVDPAKVPINSPEREALRGRAQLEVTIRSRENADDPRWRARHLNLLGVLTMSRFSNFGGEANLVLARGVGAFQSAIEVDPANSDAKRNLEILLRRPEAAHLPPTAPVQGGSQGRVSGQGRAGGGY
jgi:hypothetical protein